ncbi:MAG: DUF4301 family protein [Bacteroidales bacterium]|nr:DUF4301 family protein [Bacteroidales bacterium]
MKFSEKDLAQIACRGISLQTIEKQIQTFEKGDSFVDIVKPATKNNGIIVPDKNTENELMEILKNSAGNYKILKFVPASGAATRMFKSLFNAINDNVFDKDASEFIGRIEDFAFFAEMNIIAKKSGNGIGEMKEAGKYREIIEILLNKMEYGALPKGLLAFHSYKNKYRTSVEEHLAEGAEYAANINNSVFIHLTVSPEHEKKFKEKVNASIPFFEEKYRVKYSISYSVQKTSTDTIAVDVENKPFREKDGTLVFRPGGHGALIENLNDLDADFVFIKNIDNVVPDHLRASTIKNKKLLLAYMLILKKQIDFYLFEIQNTDNIFITEEIVGFYKEKFFIDIPVLKQKDKEYLTKLLNRPIRICGMVRNQGEPGGGPFFVKEKDGSVSLQIVESSQINLKDSDKKKIFSEATHFNPVDLLCSIKDYKGDKFNLLAFVDSETGFISEKSKDGKPLKAYELPGLWNGAMANWNTVFMEVPLDTFNPVKTINDLLRERHLGL